MKDTMTANDPNPLTGAQVIIDDISLPFGNGNVLRGFSLTAEPGETIVITGPSGSGKSSVLGCILGFVTPASGAITIDGVRVTAESIWSLRRKMGYVPQEPVLGDSRVREWIGEQYGYAANSGVRANLAGLPGLLRRFNLAESVLDQPGTELSGGEKQRVALAAALLLDRPLLLLDEPTSALDPVTRDAVYGYLRDLTATTKLLVSHDDAEILAFADRIIPVRPYEEGDAIGSD